MQFFSQSFENFENLEKGLSINLDRCYWTAISTFGVTVLFQNFFHTLERDSDSGHSDIVTILA